MELSQLQIMIDAFCTDATDPETQVPLIMKSLIELKQTHKTSELEPLLNRFTEKIETLGDPDKYEKLLSDAMDADFYAKIEIFASESKTYFDARGDPELNAKINTLFQELKNRISISEDAYMMIIDVSDQLVVLCGDEVLKNKWDDLFKDIIEDHKSLDSLNANINKLGRNFEIFIRTSEIHKRIKEIATEMSMVDTMKKTQLIIEVNKLQYELDALQEESVELIGINNFPMYVKNFDNHDATCPTLTTEAKLINRAFINLRDSLTDKKDLEVLKEQAYKFATKCFELDQDPTVNGSLGKLLHEGSSDKFANKLERFDRKIKLYTVYKHQSLINDVNKLFVDFLTNITISSVEEFLTDLDELCGDNILSSQFLRIF